MSNKTQYGSNTIHSAKTKPSIDKRQAKMRFRDQLLSLSFGGVKTGGSRTKLSSFSSFATSNSVGVMFTCFFVGFGLTLRFSDSFIVLIVPLQ